MKDYNFGAKYSIIGRILNRTTVEYYVLQDRSNNSTLKMKKGVVEQLALSKQIYNCSAQVYKDIVNMKGINCKLSQLPRYSLEGEHKEYAPVYDEIAGKNGITLVGKVQHGRYVTDYVVICEDQPDKLMKITRDIIIKLAKDGRVTNAKVQMNGPQILLRGTKENLSRLRNYV